MISDDGLFDIPKVVSEDRVEEFSGWKLGIDDVHNS